MSHYPEIVLGDKYVLPEGTQFEYMFPKNSAATSYRHDCGPRCVSHLRLDHINLNKCNPFFVPFLYGFVRVAMMHPDHAVLAKKDPDYKDGVQIAYVSPCRKILICLRHIQEYLQVVQLDLDIDHFTFSRNFMLKQITIKNALSYSPDITEGKETRPISCLNQFERHGFDFSFKYTSSRVFSTEIAANLTEFVVSCECKDDCSSDIENCICRMLTKVENCGETGYVFKRLLTKKVFGIFECNHGCKCSSKCHNRVLQNGIKCQLQVFATEHKGWGVRALHFIPQGTFVCAYNGEILTDEQANKVKVDDFLAALDHYEVAQREADPANLPPEKRLQPGEELNLDRFQLFGQKNPLVIDGARYSNLGRLFNHSCSPNMFTQNVFVETHDLRLSHIGFFSLRDIAPFEELTWDYNWSLEKDSKKPLFCNCDTLRCCIRLR